jgi:hypothetical protein
MMRLILVAALFVSTGFAVAGAQAQDPEDLDAECPDSHVCVTHGEDVVAIDPGQGHLQQIITKEQEVIVRTFDSESVTIKVQATTYLKNGDTYDRMDERMVDRSGIYAEADLGDVYVMGEVAE